jgi:hypothetical protein
VNKDDMSDDAEFDAFLKGDDALSRQFQAMPQAGPSAALDAAILQRARELMAQETRPQAANDAGIATPAPRVAGLGWRWRVPGAIAATVLAGVFAHQAYQASADMERNTGMPAEEAQVQPVPAPAPAPAPAADVAPAAPVVEAVPEDRKAQTPVLHDAPAKVALPAPVSPSLPKPVAVAPAAPAAAPPPYAERAAAAPPPAPIAAIAEEKRDYVTGYSAPPPPAAAPAPAPERAPSVDAYESLQRVEIAGSRNTARDKESAMGIAARKREDEAKFKRVEVTGSRIKSVAAEMTPDEWFGVIEDMLENDKGSVKEKAVLAEWRKFRKMYPSYPVPDTFSEKIKALEK